MRSIRRQLLIWLLALVIVGVGFAGWLILGAMFLLAAAGVTIIAHRAAREVDRTAADG